MPMRDFSAGMKGPSRVVRPHFVTVLSLVLDIIDGKKLLFI